MSPKRGERPYSLEVVVDAEQVSGWVKQSGKTPTRLAAETGIGADTIRKWVNGYTKHAYVWRIEALKKACGVE